MWDRVEEAAAALRSRCGAPPQAAVVLGSGLGEFAERLQEAVSTAYGDLPHWPVPTMLACLLFGFAEALTIQMQGVAKLPSGEEIPVQFVQMIPYVVTIVVLAGFIGQSRAPGALGLPYSKER